MTKKAKTVPRLWRRCPACGNFMPPGFDRCDGCLLRDYTLEPDVCPAFEVDGWGFSRKKVCAALRLAERRKSS